MKTLKFMLAAATAIGLASATQADQYNTTGFEKLTVGDPVGTGVTDNDSASYFWYTGSVAEDNESVIAAADAELANIARPRGAASVDSGRDKILQVSTGTDPLMRTYAPLNGTTPQNPSTITEDTYVDTLVQFTVTPYTDTVNPGSSDKLMIYLKETTNTVDASETSTNLVVVGGYHNGTTTVAKEYRLNTGSVTVNPNEWHRLTVKAIVDISGAYGARLPGFQIWVDGTLCTLNGAVTYDALNADALDLFGAFSTADDIDNGKIVLSLLAAGGEQTATLQGVGFAGEGKVDDIVFGTVDPFATVFDFTFALGTGVSAVTYTVGGTEYDQARTFPEVVAGTAVEVTSITYTDAYMEGTRTAVNLSDPVSGVYTVTNAGASLTITPEQFFPRTNTPDQDGTAAHPYEVADAAALKALQKGVLAGKNITGKNFVLTGNIDMTGVTDFYGIGWFESSDSYASLPPGVASAKTSLPFTGVFDGAGYTISNVTIVRHNYAGVFNNVSGTVKNLTVQNLGFSGTCSEWGCAIVGNAAAGSLLSNLTAAASTVWGDNANHNVAGIVVRPIGTATIYGCVNNANITASGKRVGGVAAFVGSGSTGTVFDSCTNNAAIVSSNGTRGVGGILGCAEGNTTATATLIRNCADFGSETAQAEGGHAGAIVGSNWNGSYTYTDDGGNTFKASTVDCGFIKNQIFGRTYSVASTIGGTPCLTTVKQADLAANNQYTLLTNVVSGTVFTLQADGDFIAFALNGYTFGGTVDGAEGLTVTDATESGVTTFTAAASAPSGETIAPGEQSSTTYTTSADATAALANVTITAPDAVTNALDSAAQATYLANFEAKVVEVGENQYKVEVGLTTAAETALQAQADADAAEVIDDLSESTVTLTTTPGFYYSFEYGTTLGGMAEVGTRTLATGSSLTLTRPTSSGATAGFYKVLVNVTDKE